MSGFVGALALGIVAIVEIALADSRSLGLAGVAFGVLMLAGWVAGAGTAAIGRGLERAGRWEPIVLAAVGAPWVVWLAACAFEGRRARTMAGKSAMQAALVVVGVFALWVASRGVIALRERLRAGRPAGMWGATLLVVAAALVIGDHVLLPRLYPFFHISLRMASVAAALAGAAALAPTRRARLPVLLVALGGGPVALAALAAFPELRAAAFERGSLSSLARLPIWQGEASRSLRAADNALAPPAGPRFPGRDVFLLTVDALRADRLGSYGYRRPTPNLDRLAAQSVVFDRAYASTPHTSFSLASILTGRHVHARLAQAASAGRVSVGAHETLPEILRTFRVKTAGFFPPAVFFIDHERFLDYEQSAYGFEYVKYEFLDATLRAAQLGAFLDADGRGRQVFAWIHYFEPHEPYLRQPGFDFGPSASDRYDGEVAATDRAVGRLLARIDAERPDAIVIVTADHGEEFDDHGGHYHGTTLFDEQLRVPLIVRVPGVAPRRVRAPVGTVDIAPTLLSLLDIPTPAGLDGVDLSPWMAEGPLPESLARVQRPVFAEVLQKRMIARGDEKLVCDFAGGFCSLYDLARDPGERHDLATERPARVAALRRDLQRALDRLADVDDHDPAERALARARAGDPEAAEGLRALIAGADIERARLAAGLLFDISDRLDAAAVPRGVGGDVELAERLRLAAARAGDAAARADVRALLDRPDLPSAMRFQAALALAERGDGSGLGVLARAVAAGESFEQRVAAASALGGLRDCRATAPLLAVLADVRMRRFAVRALGALGDPRAVPRLCALVGGDSYISVREESARALGRIGDRAAAVDLLAAARREREPSVVAAALEALDALGRLPPDAVPCPSGDCASLVMAPRAGSADLWLLYAPGASGRVRLRIGTAEAEAEIGPKRAVAMPIEDAAGATRVEIDGPSGLRAVWRR